MGDETSSRAELVAENARLRRQLDFYRQILDDLPSQVAVFDEELRYLYVNAASISDPELRRWILGKTDAEYCRLRGKDLSLARKRDYWRRQAIEERRPIRFEEVLRTPAGERRHFSRMHSPVVEPDGSIAWLLGYGIDVTEHKRLESELQQSQKLEVVGKLAGGVAHDFNNLLTAILGYCEILTSEIEGLDGAARDALGGHVEEIRKAGEHAASLTRQLLAFSRKQVFHTRVFDLNAVVEDMVNLLERTIGEDIELEVSLGRDLPSVRADPSQLRQVILNLAVNARDAMPGGGRFLIATRCAVVGEGELDDDREPGRYLRLTVADSGCGMPPEVCSRIFEPFFTTKSQGRGTGLGLSMVYGIVKQSGGHIAVASDPGRGSTFDVYLPATEAAAGREAAPMPRARPAGSGRGTILVVEDEPAVRRLASESLSRMGYRVLEAVDASEALSTGRRHPGPIDLLLTDVVMPGSSGYELAERLAVARPELKVLYMSGYTGAAARELPSAATGPLLEKPFAPAELGRRVRAVLGELELEDSGLADATRV